METRDKSLKLSEEQALFFRSRRGFLVEGASTVAQCARDILGLQSQQLAPGLLALSQRLNTRPTAAELQDHLFAESRDLVRLWGQRDTIHIYDAQASWALISSARQQWSPGGRRGPLPSTESQQSALDLALAKGLVLKKDFLPLIEPQYLKELDPRIGDDGARANFASGRLVWLLSLDGQLCLGEKQGSRQIYATRRLWFPKLEWPDSGTDPLSACVALTRGYLKVNAPATVRDIAHFFGAKVSTARQWLEVLAAEGELMCIECGDRRDLVALVCDETDLQVKPGRGAGAWPVRLLPLWDTHLMSHRDKSWTMPHAREHPLVWRKAAHVSSVVLARGRVVAVWKMQRRGRRLNFELHPLSGWKNSAHRKGFVLETEAVARHLEMQHGAIT